MTNGRNLEVPVATIPGRGGGFPTATDVGSVEHARLVGACSSCGASLFPQHLEQTSSGIRCVFCGADRGTAPEPGGDLPADVGDVLRTARHVRGLSLETAATETRIREKYLVALEENHSVSEFPGQVYARFFLRDYAEFLGLDAKPLLRSFDDVVEEPRSSLAPRAVPQRRVRRWGPAAAIAVVMLTTAIVAGRAVGGSGTPPSSIPRGPVTSPAAGAGAGGIATTRPPSHTARRGVRATIEATERCWVEATADGVVVFSETLEPGQTRHFHADRTLKLALGNAGGVRLKVDGKVVPTSGGVRHLTFHARRGGGRSG